MAVKSGIERRTVSAPAETWARLDALAAAAGVPAYFAFREVFNAGFSMMPAHALGLRHRTGDLPRIVAGQSGGRRK